MRKLLIATIALLWACGCAAHNPGPGMGWHPQTEQEMERLIGNTVMRALHQYQQYMQSQLRKAPRDNMDLRFPDKPIV